MPNPDGGFLRAIPVTARAFCCYSPKNVADALTCWQKKMAVQGNKATRKCWRFKLNLKETQMKFSSRSVALVLVCLALTACNKPAEENASPKESNVNDAGATDGTQRKLPECAKRNKDGTYKYGHACSAEEWVEWQKTQPQ